MPLDLHLIVAILNQVAPRWLPLLADRFATEAEKSANNSGSTKRRVAAAEARDAARLAHSNDAWEDWGEQVPLNVLDCASHSAEAGVSETRMIELAEQLLSEWWNSQ